MADRNSVQLLLDNHLHTSPGHRLGLSASREQVSQPISAEHAGKQQRVKVYIGAPPNKRWLASTTILPAIRSHGMYGAVEVSLSSSAAGAPVELLRRLAREADDPQSVALSAAAEGNHLVACSVRDAGGSGPGVIVLSSAGAARHLVAIAVFLHDGSSVDFEVVTSDLVAVTGQSICEMQLAPKTRHGTGLPQLVAVRCTQSIALMALCPPVTGNRWVVRIIATHHMGEGMLAMAWNRSLAGELAVVSSNGSVHCLATSAHALSVDLTDDTTASPTPSPQRPHSSMAIKSRCVLSASAVVDSGWNGESAIGIVALPHPRRLLVAAATSLMLLEVGPPAGQSAGMLQGGQQLQLLHERPEGDAFVALACDRKLGKRQQDSCQPACDLANGLAENLVAALTVGHALLFDVRRPAKPLAQWAHGLTSPTLVALECHVTEAAVTGGAALQGGITVAALHSGDLLHFSFTASHPGAQLLAAAAMSPGLQQSRRHVDADITHLPGTLTWLPAGTDPPWTAAHDTTGAEAPSTSFAWRPLLAWAVRPDTLPRRIAVPLQRLVTKNGGTAALLHPELSPTDLADVADLQGFAVVPFPTTDHSSTTAALLVRLSPLADLFVEKCHISSCQAGGCSAAPGTEYTLNPSSAYCHPTPTLELTADEDGAEEAAGLDSQPTQKAALPKGRPKQRPYYEVPVPLSAKVISAAIAAYATWQQSPGPSQQQSPAKRSKATLPAGNHVASVDETPSAEYGMAADGVEGKHQRGHTGKLSGSQYHEQVVTDVCLTAREMALRADTCKSSQQVSGGSASADDGGGKYGFGLPKLPLQAAAGRVPRNEHRNPSGRLPTVARATRLAHAVTAAVVGFAPIRDGSLPEGCSKHVVQLEVPRQHDTTRSTAGRALHLVPGDSFFGSGVVLSPTLEQESQKGSAFPLCWGSKSTQRAGEQQQQQNQQQGSQAEPSAATQMFLDSLAEEWSRGIVTSSSHSPSRPFSPPAAHARGLPRQRQHQRVSGGTSHGPASTQQPWSPPSASGFVQSPSRLSNAGARKGVTQEAQRQSGTQSQQPRQPILAKTPRRRAAFSQDGF